jgi:formate hydrogenlyase subunit 6/NADH:ubiquinone oxidoreductase subunit I
VNIFSLIFQNLRRGPVSFRLPHKHECTSDQYRGLIVNDAERCVGCGLCAYVCPTAAIVVTRSGDNYSWAYDAGKCTFCGRCLERCKPHTLSMESQLPPLYSTQGELINVLDMVRKRPVRPAPASPAATGNPATAATAEAAPATPAAAATEPAV